MAEDDLAHILSELRVAEPDTRIDDLLEEPRPRKRAPQSDEELRKDVEREFLTPSNVFSTEWLNRLQS